MNKFIDFMFTLGNDSNIIISSFSNGFNIENKTKKELINNIEKLKKYFKNNKIQRINLTKYIKENNINKEIKDILSTFTENTLYKSLVQHIKDKDNLTLDEVCVLGFKLCNIGSITSQIIQNDYRFNILKLVFTFLDSMFYYTDNNNKELDYIFINFIHKISNTNITLKDIDFLLTTIILIILIDLNPKYNDQFDYTNNNINDLYKDTSNKQLKLKTIVNPLNFIIYINNPRIKLPSPSVLSILSTITKYIDTTSIKNILNSAFTDYNDKNLYYSFEKNSNEYYTSFGHYLGHVLKFNIDNLPILQNSAILVKLSQELINANQLFYKYSNSYKTTQYGGGNYDILYNFFKRVSTHTSKAIKYPSLKYTDFQLKKYNKYTYKSFIDLHYNKYKLYYSNSLLSMYHEIDNNYPILSRLLINMSYNIKNADLKSKYDIGEYKQPQSKYLELYINNKDILDSVINYIIDSIKAHTNIIDILKLIKFIPVIINLYSIKTNSISLDNNNTISKNFLLIIKSLSTTQSKIFNKILYCLVIITNLYKSILDYIYNNTLTITTIFKDTIISLLSKLSNSIIVYPFDFNKSLLELILHNKLYNINSVYELKTHHFNLNNSEIELLISVYDDIIKNKINTLEYTDIFNNFKTKQYGGTNSNNNFDYSQSRLDTNNSMTSNYTSRTNNYTSRTNNNTSRTSSNASRTSSNASRNGSNTSRTSSNASRTGSNTSRTRNITNVGNTNTSKLLMFLATMFSVASLPNINIWDEKIDPRNKLKNVIVNNKVISVPLDINNRIKKGEINKLNKNNKRLSNLINELDNINKAKMLNFIKRNKETIIKNQLIIFCLTLLEWQFLISHALLEEKINYSVHPDYNYFISDYSYHLLDLVGKYKNNIIQNEKRHKILNKYITFIKL